MAYTLGTVVDTASTASVTTIDAVPTFLAHDFGVAYLTYGSGSAVAESMADTSGNTWVKLGSTVSDAGNSQSSCLFYCKDCAAGTPTVTGTFASAQVYRGLWIVPVRGLDNTATPVGGGQIQSSPGTGTDAVTSGNITPSAQPGIFLGFVFDSSGSNPTFTRGTGFTNSAAATNINSTMGLTTLREDMRITSTSAKAATFTASVGSGGFITLAFTAPEAAVAAPSIGSRIRRNTIHPGRHPDRFGKRLKTRRHNTATLSTIVGTAAITNVNDTSAASGSPVVSGTLAKTNANDAISAAGSPVVNGSLAKTNVNDTSAAAGAPAVSGSASIADANDTSAAAGSAQASQPSRRLKRTITPGRRGPYNPFRFQKTARNQSTALSADTGTAAIQNASDTLAASGAPTVSGTLSKTNVNDSSAAAGAPAITGSLSDANANDTLAAAGSATVTGSLAKTNANDTAAAAGTPIVSGSLAKTDADDTLAAQGTVGNGRLDYTNINDTLAATGSTTVTGSASIANANDSPSAFGTAGVAIQGGGAVIVDLPKKRGRKPKKASEAIEPAAEQTETLPASAETSRIISEEEAAGMAAIYGTPEKRAEIEPVSLQETEISTEVEPADALEPFEIPESVYGAEPAQPEEVAEPVEATEEDDIALILAIIEAIG